MPSLWMWLAPVIVGLVIAFEFAFTAIGFIGEGIVLISVLAILGQGVYRVVRQARNTTAS